MYLALKHLCQTRRRTPWATHQGHLTNLRKESCMGAKSSSRTESAYMINSSCFHNLLLLTLCMPGRPSRGFLQPPWRDVRWPVGGCCRPFYPKRYFSRWMKTECRRELLLFPRDLPGSRQSSDLHPEKYISIVNTVNQGCALLFVEPVVAFGCLTVLNRAFVGKCHDRGSDTWISCWSRIVFRTNEPFSISC